MRRQLIMILLVVVCSLSAAATEWKELEWSAEVVSDYRTGLPAIIFSTGLAYDEQPETMNLHIAWEVFRIDGSSETILHSYSRSATAAYLNTYFSSQAVLIEPGQWYGARVRIEDRENALSYARTFDYIHPFSLPVGLRFVGWDGTQTADLAAMTDEQLDELVLLERSIASYDILAENVSIGEFFAKHATTADVYPVSVVLLPETGVTSNWGSDSKPITVTFGLTVLTFPIPSRDASTKFQQQLSRYDQIFKGTVYAGSNASGESTIVFVHDAMIVMLTEAVAELATRSNE